MQSAVDPAAAHQFLISRLRDQSYDLFYCLYLGNRHRLIAFDELFRGTIDGACMDPRAVIKPAPSRIAAAVIPRTSRCRRLKSMFVRRLILVPPNRYPISTRFPIC